MLCAGHQPDLGDVRARGFVEMQQDRQADARRHACFDTDAKGDKDGCQNGGKVRFGIGPAAAQDAEIDKA